MSVQSILTETRPTARGRVVIVTIARPHVLNAIDDEVLAGLDAVARELSAATDAVALVITGAGERAFCAGADIATFSSLDALGAEELMRRGQRVFQVIEDIPAPVVAAINGFALGGGLELALACDVRFAAATAKMGQPEATLANLPGWGGTQRLPRAVGEARAKDLIFSGRLIGAADAERYGLVQSVVPPDELLEHAVAYAASLLATGRTALSQAKQAVHAARLAGEAGYAVERSGVALCFTTPEQQGAVRAFLAKKR